jgi:hypothetical protein
MAWCRDLVRREFGPVQASDVETELARICAFMSCRIGLLAEGGTLVPAAGIVDEPSGEEVDSLEGLMGAIARMVAGRRHRYRPDALRTFEWLVQVLTGETTVQRIVREHEGADGAAISENGLHQRFHRFQQEVLARLEQDRVAGRLSSDGAYRDAVRIASALALRGGSRSDAVRRGVGGEAIP